MPGTEAEERHRWRMSLVRRPNVLKAAGLLISLTLSITTVNKAAAQDFSRIVEKNRSSVAFVFVEQNDGSLVSGTAFAVSGTKLLITAAHVVTDAKGLFVVRYADGSYSLTKAALIWREKDVALLQPAKAPATGLIGRTSALRVGEPIIVIGYPLADKLGVSQVSVTQGIISALDADMVRLNVSVNAGNSGGPVLDASGSVVGVVRAVLKGTGFAIASPWRDVQAALDSQAHGIYPLAVSLVDSQDYVTGWIEQGVVLVEARPLANLLKGTVLWDPQTRTLTLAVGGKRLRLVVGSRSMDVDGQQVTLPVPVTADRRIPLKPVVTALGGSVDVDLSSFTVRVYLPFAVVGTTPARPSSPTSTPIQPSPPPPAPPIAVPTPAPTPTAARVSLPDGSSSWTIRPGTGIGPIVLGLLRTQVETLIGLPDQTRPFAGSTIAIYETWMLAVYYSNPGATVIGVSVGIIPNIDVYPNSSLDLRGLFVVTPSGIRIGDPRANVIAAHGAPARTSTSADKRFEVIQYPGVAFGVFLAAASLDAVVFILVGF